MTEQEAIEWLEAISAKQTPDNYKASAYERQEALHIGIQALKEVQQYRALGTARQIEYFIADWRKYKELGNLEKVREAMEKQMAKKPFKNSCEEHTHYKCKCGYIFYTEYSDGFKMGCMYEYCPDCGQHIDWT